MRRYYNPELSEEEVRQLDRVNFIVLMSGQALLGFDHSKPEGRVA